MGQAIKYADRLLAVVCSLSCLLGLSGCDVARLATGRPNVFTGYDRPSSSSATYQAAPASSAPQQNWVRFFNAENNDFQAYYDKPRPGSCAEPDGDGGCVVEVELRSLSRTFSDTQRTNFIELFPDTNPAFSIERIEIAYGIDCQRRLLRLYTYFFTTDRTAKG